MMFHKPKTIPESFIGMYSRFKGEIVSKRGLRVDGFIEGSIVVDQIVIGERARVTGDIYARDVAVAGKVEGNIHAKESINIGDKGQVIGGVNAPHLSLSKGARFDGRSIILPEG